MKLAGALAVAALGAACGTSPVQACKDQGVAECKKMWSCDAAVKLGSDEASCITTYAGLCEGFAKEGKCEGGKTMDLGRVVACTADIEKASCDEYKSGTFRAANCEAACR
ncbi:MAG: hypothetical protein ACOZIN_09365 [Myxococcota bacterium]